MLCVDSRLLLLSAANALQTQDDQQKCSGMYSKKSWGGKVDPFIMVKFVKNGDKNKDVQDPTVGVVIWEWKDSMLLGKPSDMPVDEVRQARNMVRVEGVDKTYSASTSATTIPSTRNSAMPRSEASGFWLTMPIPSP